MSKIIAEGVEHNQAAIGQTALLVLAGVAMLMISLAAELVNRHDNKNVAEKTGEDLL